MIVPNPLGNEAYYVFSIDVSIANNGLRYSEIDMNLNGGMGDVTANNLQTLGLAAIWPAVKTEPK